MTIKNKNLQLAKVSNKMMSLKEKNKLTRIFNQSNLVGFIEMITGFIGTDKSELLMTAGRLGQGLVKGEGLKQLFLEIQELREKGKIKDEYLNSKYGKKTFADILKLIDEENIDPAKWDAIKRIFFSSVSSNSKEKGRTRAYYLMQTCFLLKTLDFEILRVCYEIYTTPNHAYQNIKHAGEWVGIVSDKLGYGLPEFVEKSENRLIDQNLISDRTYSDRSGVSTGQSFRLTRLGIALCEMISKAKFEVNLYDIKVLDRTAQ